MTQEPIASLRSRLQWLLDDSGETAHAVSLACGTNPRLLADILSGKVKDPRVFTLKRIAEHLGVTVGFLIGETKLRDLLAETGSKSP